MEFALETNTIDIVKSTVGRNHMAPAEYPYCIKYASHQDIFLDLNKENTTAIGNVEGPNSSIYICNGKNKINNYDVWIINQEKQGYYYFWYKSRQDAIDLHNYLDQKKKDKENKSIHAVYKFSCKQGWIQLNTYSCRNPNDLIGYENYVDRINTDINNYKRFIDFLNSVGEGNRTLNYLLYGPPGTGKTTMIKTFASIHNYPIFIVNPTLMDNVNASDVLNPKKNINNKTKIILFEDFDRYLKEGKFNMSEILNELDGIETTDGCIRFFTCNDIDEIKKHDALINRMNCKFYFDYPNQEHFLAKLNRLLTYHHTINDEKKEQFMTLFNEMNKNKNITLRPFTTFIIRYLFDDNCLDKMIENINELFL